MTFRTLPMILEAGSIMHSRLPVASAFLITERAFASGSIKTMISTSLVFDEPHVVGYLTEALPAHVHAVLPDERLLAAAPAAHVRAAPELLARSLHYLTSTP